jgi:hypothetical protein
MKVTKQTPSNEGGTRLLQLGIALLGLCVSIATANAAQRPIADFLSAQGSYFLALDAAGNVDCVASHSRLPGEGDGFLWVDPIRNFTGWSDPSPDRPYFLSMDYAGLAEAWLIANGMSLGTTFSGSISERALPDGRAEVSVILLTRNALAWAGDMTTGGFADGELVFGYRAPDVLAGAPPALGDSLLQITFINAAPGAPLPDLQELMFCRAQDLLTMSASITATGALRPQFGVPDGTPGMLHTRQTGLIRVAGQANDNSRVARDSFPAERITIKPVGK